VYGGWGASHTRFSADTNYMCLQRLQASVVNEP
jgi:hypothetical protein